MFPVRYWCDRFFASRFWPKVGSATPTVDGEPIVLTYSVPATVALDYTVPGPLALTYAVPATIALTYDQDGV